MLIESTIMVTTIIILFKLKVLIAVTFNQEPTGESHGHMVSMMLPVMMKSWTSVPNSEELRKNQSRELLTHSNLRMILKIVRDISTKLKHLRANNSESLIRTPIWIEDTTSLTLEVQSRWRASTCEQKSRPFSLKSIELFPSSNVEFLQRSLPETFILHFLCKSSSIDLGPKAYAINI